MEEKKNSMTILINGENTVIKFTVYNIFSKRGRDWNLSVSKTVSTRNISCCINTANIKVSCEMIKAFLLRPGTRQACLLSPFYSTLNWRSQTVQTGNIAIIEKRETIGKEEIKNNTFSLFTDATCLCSPTFQKRNVNGTAILENNMEVKHAQIELSYHIANSSSECLSEGN